MLDEQIKPYKKNGFIMLPGFFSRTDFEDLLSTAESIMKMQIQKLGIKVLERPSAEIDLSRPFETLVETLYTSDQNAFENAVAMLPLTAAGRRLASNADLLKICSNLLEAPEDILIMSGPNLRCNYPGQTKRLYTWHSEAHWYPKRRNFLNVWIPFYREKMEGNGTMLLKRGSHTQQWDFAEFQGYTKNDSESALQYEVPDSEVQTYESVAVNQPEGTLIAFDKNTVHSSSVNTSGTITYSLEFRCYDYRRDLTVAFGSGERPYSLESRRTGRPGFRV